MKNNNSDKLFYTEPYSLILSALKYGRRNAVKKHVLVKMTGLDERAVRKCIEDIRRAGICIISDTVGYYYPENRQEIERYIRRVERTAKSHFYTLRAAKKELERFGE